MGLWHKRPGLDIVSCKSHRVLCEKENFGFYIIIDRWKMHFLKPGKYCIINKSKTNSYTNFYIILYESQQWKFWKKQETSRLLHVIINNLYSIADLMENFIFLRSGICENRKKLTDPTNPKKILNNAITPN